MNFLEALQRLKNGANVRLAGWDEGVWVCHDKYFGDNELAFVDQDGESWEPHIPEIESREWEEYKERKQCGMCRWWAAPGYCSAPVPQVVLEHFANLKASTATRATDGGDCASWEELS